MSTSLSGYGPKAAAGVTNVEVEKYSSLYDGSLEKYERFISEVTLILKSKDALASHIIAGTIQVQKRQRGLGESYEMKGNILTSQELIRSMQAKVAANEAELTNILTTAQLQAIKENKTLPADFPFMKVVEILESTDMFEKRKGDQKWRYNGHPHSNHQRKEPQYFTAYSDADQATSNQTAKAPQGILSC